MITEKSVLISIEGSWNKARNLGNFVPGELGILESQIEAKNVKIVHDSGGTWVSLTEKGLERLYKLNSYNVEE